MPAIRYTTIYESDDYKSIENLPLLSCNGNPHPTNHAGLLFVWFITLIMAIAFMRLCYNELYQFWRDDLYAAMERRIRLMFVERSHTLQAMQLPNEEREAGRMWAILKLGLLNWNVDDDSWQKYRKEFLDGKVTDETWELVSSQEWDELQNMELGEFCEWWKATDVEERRKRIEEILRKDASGFTNGFVGGDLLSPD